MTLDPMEPTDRLAADVGSSAEAGRDRRVTSAALTSDDAPERGQEVLSPPTLEPRRTPPEHQRCTARSKQTGERCRRYRSPGALVCISHGAGAPQVKAAAQRRLERHRTDGEVAALLAELGIDAEADPIETLLEAQQHAATMTRLLRELVGGLSPMHDRVDVDTQGRIKAALFGPDHLGDAKPHVLVAMLGEWTDRAARISKVVIDAGIDERLTRIQERDLDLLEGAFTAMVREIGSRLDGLGVNGQLVQTLLDPDHGEWKRIFAHHALAIDAEVKER